MATKEQIESLIKLVTEIANQPGNEWVRRSLNEKFNNPTTIETSNGGSSLIVDIKKDTNKVIELLEISPECSIDYSFIPHKLLRTRLELDNLRMENVRYDLKEKDHIKRLFDFSVNAFYQIENLLNYYYFEKYQKIEDLLYHFESIEGTHFKRTDNHRNINDISIATKIFTFNRTFYNSKNGSQGFNIDSLRLIRNEGLHRCTRISKIENENPRLHKFIAEATFDSIQSIVKNLAEKVNQLLTSK
ncbi:hypothetical protein [Aquirufa lenticrescens]|uniref:hypothetical protein n=1 Tax=Aquirufa lenticrescens TaxID=2696560 RepID=UPI001CAA5856|nr:hypothetical protein [Aquirufa lenticrescens]UAJ14346.1 hypothetical protein G9X62_07145 [Aquirufa lenticrescens]